MSFTVNYPATNPDATGLGLKIYYDSSKLTPTGGDTGFPTGLTNVSTDKLQGVQGLADTSNGDGDTTTDNFFNLAWAATSQFAPIWNPSGQNLVTVTFQTSAGFTSDTKINFTGDPAAGNTFSSSPIPVKLKVTTVNNPPVVTAPADITKVATGTLTTVNLGTATVTDDHDTGLTATPSDTGPFTVGTHTITWTATDSGDKTGTDTQKVTITPKTTIDTIPPVVTAPANITREATGATTAVNLGSATVTDNVDTGLIAIPSPRGPFALGTHTITWTATDRAGNKGTATQTVTIKDTTPPVITVPRDMTVYLPEGKTEMDVDFGRATAYDRVDGNVAVSVSGVAKADIRPFSAGTYTITWSAADARGNTASSSQTLRVLAAGTAIPTLSEWGIILLSIMLAFLSLTGLGRKKTLS